MDNYYKNISNGKGSVFFAVCRGKVSEGLDFANSRGRAVIITGIPYPPVKDPKVILKRQYLDDLRKTGGREGEGIISGDEWYHQQASRAVNQAIGRVIRHRHDYGAILLFDDRFASSRSLGQLSKWIRPHVKVNDSFSEMRLQLKGFFDDRSIKEAQKITIPEVHQPSGAQLSLLDDWEKAQEAMEEARLFFNQDKTEGNVIPMMLVEEGPIKAPSNTPASFLKAFTAPPQLNSVKRIEAHEFIRTIKGRLSVDSQGQFTKAIKAYRSDQLAIDRLIRSVLDLFEREKATDLVEGFRNFIPSKHQNLFEQILSGRSVSAESTVVIERKRPATDPIDMTLSVSSHHSPPEQECPVCHLQFTNPYRGKCGHVLCYTCWNTWLQQKLECPICRHRTRIPQLKKVFL